tara:strand:- start:624 stop:1028 length:405 start_codon:yes stop_codon:yes gene_type:complete
VVKNDAGKIIEIQCTYDPDTHGGQAPDGRKVRGTIHWVSAQHAVNAQSRLYNALFNVEHPDKEDDFIRHINPDSITVESDSKVEPSLTHAESGSTFQFERLGYFTVDPDTHPGALVFNRTVTLRDSWGKQQRRK